MATYEYTGNTEQFDVNHVNRVVAMKVDPLATPMFTVLAYTTAAANGDFTLTWDNWAGRVVIGAFDENEDIQLECKFHDWQAGKALPAEFYEGIVVADAPVFYYRLDEASGTTAFDSSGNNNHGTYSGPVLAQTGLITSGESASFDGVDDYVSPPLINFLSETEVTVEAWVNFDTLVNSRNGILFHGAGGEFYLSVSNVETATYTARFATKLSDTSLIGVNGTTEIVPGQTYHLVGRWVKGQSIEIFVDGLLETSSSIADLFLYDPQPPTTTPFFNTYIGCRDSGDAVPSELSDAKIDEVAVYNYALTSDQIVEHYHAGKLTTLTTAIYSDAVLKESPLVYYKLDEAVGTTAADSSGNGYDATYAGSPLLNQNGLTVEGSSVDFDGVNDYVSRAQLQFTYPVTLEAWVKLPDIADGVAHVVFNTHDQVNTNTRNGIEVYITTGGTVAVILGDGGLIASSDYIRVRTQNQVIFNNTTHHIVAVVNSFTSIDLYIDGIYQTALITDGTATGPLFQPTNSFLRVGTRQAQVSNHTYMNGFIDDAVIYNNKALDAHEILDHYLIGKYGNVIGPSIGVPTSGLKAFWKFEEGTGTAVSDSFGTFNGTMTSSVLWDPNGKFGGGVVGDGTNYINLATGADIFGLGATNEFTVAAWFYIPTGNSSNISILDMGLRSGNTNESNAGLRFTTGGFRVISGEDDAPELTDTTDRGVWSHGLMSNLAYDEWNLLIMTRTLTRADAYLYNSRGVSTDSITYASNLLDDWENRRNLILADTNGFTGSEVIQTITPAGNKLDSLGVWNRVLTAQERDAIWSHNKGKDLP